MKHESAKYSRKILVIDRHYQCINDILKEFSPGQDQIRAFKSV